MTLKEALRKKFWLCRWIPGLASRINHLVLNQYNCAEAAGQDFKEVLR